MANNRDIPEVKKLKLDEHEQKQQEVLKYISDRTVIVPANVKDNNVHQLVSAPHNILEDVLAKKSGLELQDISHLAQTCRRFHHFFQPIVDKAAIKKLLQHIAYGEQAEAEKMIDAAPHLLQMSGTVVDYSLRTIIDVTPAQLAFGGDDEVMCAMLKEKCGEAEFLRQIREKFPEDDEAEIKAAEFDELLNQLAAGISDPLANIHDELNHVPNESPLRNLLDSFRMQFAPGEVEAGKHFNAPFLLKALEIYDDNYDDWDIERCRLFWRQVVGYLERLLPVSYVQAGCQGIDDVLRGVPLKRILTLVDKTPYYPLDANPANRLGFDHGIYLGAAGAVCALRGGGWKRTCSFGKLMSSKNVKLAELMRPYREEKTCVVC